MYNKMMSKKSSLSDANYRKSSIYKFRARIVLVFVYDDIIVSKFSRIPKTKYFSIRLRYEI